MGDDHSFATQLAYYVRRHRCMDTHSGITIVASNDGAGSPHEIHQTSLRVGYFDAHVEQIRIQLHTYRLPQGIDSLPVSSTHRYDACPWRGAGRCDVDEVDLVQYF